MNKTRLVCISPDNRFNAYRGRELVARAALPENEQIEHQELEAFRLTPQLLKEEKNDTGTPELA
jgi:hypothetical protein